MKQGNKELLVVGDRVLVRAEKPETRTNVRGGSIVAIGPGQPLPPPQEEHEPWKDGYRSPRFMPMQVQLGDYALFFRKAAIEITFEDDNYLVVPYGAILVLVRGEATNDDEIPDQLPDQL